MTTFFTDLFNGVVSGQINLTLSDSLSAVAQYTQFNLPMNVLQNLTIEQAGEEIQVNLSVLPSCSGTYDLTLSGLDLDLN